MSAIIHLVYRIVLKNSEYHAVEQVHARPGHGWRRLQQREARVPWSRPAHRLSAATQSAQAVESASARTERARAREREVTLSCKRDMDKNRWPCAVMQCHSASRIVNQYCVTVFTPFYSLHQKSSRSTDARRRSLRAYGRASGASLRATPTAPRKTARYHICMWKRVGRAIECITPWRSLGWLCRERSTRPLSLLVASGRAHSPPPYCAAACRTAAAVGAVVEVVAGEGVEGVVGAGRHPK